MTTQRIGRRRTVAGLVTGGGMVLAGCAAPPADRQESPPPRPMPVVQPTRPPTTLGVVPPMAVPTTGSTTAAVPQPIDTPAATLPPLPTPTLPPVATSDLGTPQPLPGLVPPRKPFIAFPKLFGGDNGPGNASAEKRPPPGDPSPLLVEHASPAAPVPLSDYGRQPDHPLSAIGIGPALSVDDVQRRLGPPAGIAGIDDPWLVYRLTFGREVWLHFGPDDRLVAADLVRGAENGYVRDRLYPE